MRTSPRPGIAALLERAGTRYAGRSTSRPSASCSRPRLNAAGRVGEAIDAARLLLAATPEEAATLAAILEAANTTRKDLMRAAIAEARAAFGLPDPGQAPGQQALARDAAARRRRRSGVAGGPDAAAILVLGPWPVGIIGLVAGRLADETGRPAIVGTVIAGRTATSIRASCRGDGRLDLAARPRRLRRPVRPPRRPRRGRRASSCPRTAGTRSSTRFLAVGAAAGAGGPAPAARRGPRAARGLVDYGLYRDLLRLAPCGPGNPEPLVAVARA